MDGKALRTYHTMREARSTGSFSKPSSTIKQQQQQRAEKQRGGSFVKSEHWGTLTVTILEGRNLCGQSTQKEASIVLKVDNDEETMSTTTYCAAPIIIWDEAFTFNISHKHFTLSLALWRRKKKKGASGKASRELNFGQSALEPWIEQGWLNLEEQEGGSHLTPGAGRAPPKCLSLRIVFKPTKVFAVPLKVLCDRYRRAIPPILEDIALFYRSTMFPLYLLLLFFSDKLCLFWDRSVPPEPDLMELFRKPPQESDLRLVESWVTAYDHGETNVDLHKCKVSGTVRLLLVKFLRELPDSLIPKSHYRDWIAITEITDEHEKREKLSSLLSALPRHNLLSLCKLILCLRHVQENSKGQSADKFPILTMASLSRSSSSASFYHPSSSPSPASSVYAASPPSPTSSSSVLEDMTQHQQHVSNSLSHLSSYSCPEKLPHVPWGFLFGSCILVPDSFGEADEVKQVQDIIQFLFENSGYVLDKQWIAEAENATTTKRKTSDPDDAPGDEEDEEENGEKEKEKEKEGGGGDDDDFFYEDDASVLTFKPGTSFLFLFTKEESEEDLQQQLLQMAEEDEQANALNELEKKRIQTKKKKRKVRRKGQRRLETRVPVGAEHSSPASIAKHAAEEEALALERERKKKSVKLEKKRGTMLGLWDDSSSTATSSNNLLTDCSSSSPLSLSSNANSFSSSASCIDFSSAVASSAASSSSASNSSASSPGRNSPVEEMMMMAEHNNALHPFNNSNSASNKNSPRLTLRKIRSISIGKSSKKNKVANNKEGGGSGSSPLHSPTSIEKQSMVAINFAPDPRKIVGGSTSSSTFIGTDYSTSGDRRIPALGGITVGDANHTMILLNKPPRNEAAGNRGSGALASITLSSSGKALGEGSNNTEPKKTKKEKKKEKREKKKQKRLIKSKSSRSMRSSLEVDASSSQSLRPPPKRQDSGGSLTSSSKDKKTKKGQTVAERASTGRVPLEGLFVDANPSAKEKKRSPVLSAYTVRPSSSSSSSSSSKASLSSFISPRNLRPVSPYANFNNNAVPLSHSSDSVHFRPSHSASASSSSSNPSSSSSSPTTSYASFPSSASSNESSVSPSLASSASSSLTVSFAPPPGEETEAQDGRGRRRTNVPPSQILSENEMQSLAKTLSMFKSDSYSSSNEETSEWAEAGDYVYDEEGAYYEGGDGYYEQQEEPEFYEGEEDSSGYWEEEEEEEEEGEDNTRLKDQSIALSAKDGLPNIRVSTVIQDGDGEDEDKRTRVVMFQTSGSTGYLSLSAPSLSLNNNNGSKVEQKEGAQQLLPTIKRPPRPVVRRHTESAPSLRSFSLSPTTPTNNPPSKLSSSSSSSSSDQATDTSANDASTPSPKRPPRPVRRSNNLSISPLSKSTITPSPSSLNPTKPSSNSSPVMSPSSSSFSSSPSSSSSSSSSSSEVVVVTTAPIWAPPSQQLQSSPRTTSANAVTAPSQHQQQQPQQRRRIVPLSREEEAFYESILVPPEVGSDFHEILAYFEHLCVKQPRRASVMLRARSYAYNNNKT
ncbi:Rho GTPase-activating protein [Balamuthia mandrillaris]